MTRRSAALFAAAVLLGSSTVSFAHGGRSSGGHFSGRAAAPAARFHSVPRVHAAPHFAPRFAGPIHRRVFIGGAIIAAPLFVPPPYYYPPPAYYAPPPSYLYFCPAYGAYYPQVQDCPSGWQVLPS